MTKSVPSRYVHGYAKAANKPAFVNVHLAAGTRQGSGQLQNAYFDASSVVIIAALRKDEVI